MNSETALDQYRKALLAMMREAGVRSPLIWSTDEDISCYTSGPYAEAIWLLCADGQMELVDDTGKILTARFKP